MKSVPSVRRTRRAAGERYFTVAEVARVAGVDAHIVRFYARTGLIRAARHAANGYRQFLPLDAKRVQFIRAAQSLGFTLADIREVMRRSHQRNTPCPLVRDIIVKRLTENRERLEHLNTLQSRMQRASDLWREMPDQTPRGDTICALIEAVAEGASSGLLPRGELARP